MAETATTLPPARAARIRDHLAAGLGVEDIRVRYRIPETETRAVIAALRRAGVHPTRQEAR